MLVPDSMWVSQSKDASTHNQPVQITGTNAMRVSCLPQISVESLTCKTLAGTQPAQHTAFPERSVHAYGIKPLQLA